MSVCLSTRCHEAQNEQAMDGSCQTVHRRWRGGASHRSHRPAPSPPAITSTGCAAQHPTPRTSQLLDGKALDDGLAAVGANHVAKLCPGAHGGLDDLQVEAQGGGQRRSEFGVFHGGAACLVTASTSPLLLERFQLHLVVGRLLDAEALVTLAAGLLGDASLGAGHEERQCIEWRSSTRLPRRWHAAQRGTVAWRCKAHC